MPIKYVQTFQTPSAYEQQMAEARRRQALAEALEAQAYRPLSGSDAPTPSAAPLVMALQSFMSARQRKKAEEAAQESEKLGRREAVDYLKSFEPEQRKVDVSQVTAMEAPTPFIDEQGRVNYQQPSAVAAPNQRLMPAMTAAGEPDFNQQMQMQVGGPLTAAQKRARALEGFASTNPLVQSIAESQFEASQPKTRELKIGEIDPSKFTAASIAEAQRTGDIGLLKEKAKAPEEITPYQQAMLDLKGREVSVRERTTGRGGKALSPTVQREVFETDENILATETGIDLLKQARALSDKSFEGLGAGQRAQAATLLPDSIEPAGAKETLEFDLLLKQQVLPQLRSIFGAAPTEGERAILLELQGSSSLPIKTRNAVLDRALQAAERRLQFNRQKSSQLREGTYFNAPAMELPDGFDLEQ